MLFTQKVSDRNIDIASRIIDLRVDNIDYVINTLRKREFDEVLNKFDNKVFNKRFETALREVSNYIRVSKDTYSNNNISIEFYFFDRRSVSTPRPNDSYSETTYIEWDRENMSYIKLADGRIDKQAIKQACNDLVKRLEATKEQLLSDQEQLTKMIEEYNSIVLQSRDFEDKYSSEVRHRLGLKF